MVPDDAGAPVEGARLQQRSPDDAWVCTGDRGPGRREPNQARACISGGSAWPDTCFSPYSSSVSDGFPACDGRSKRKERQMPPVTSWADALLTSFATGLAILFAAVPKVLGFLVILIIGWFIASAIAGAVAALLRAVHFNDVARRSGFSGFVERMGIKRDASGFLADLVKWFVRLIVLVSAFDALGLPAVSQ